MHNRTHHRRPYALTRAFALVVLAAAVSTASAAGLAPAKEWTPQRAAHLLRRAGFGGSADEIARLHEMGIEAAVASLVDYQAIPQTDPYFASTYVPHPRNVRRLAQSLPEGEREELGEHVRVINRAQLVEFRAWWLRRMTVTPRPFEEKMTLFWHGHFTTGAQEVKLSRPIIEQNRMMREHATGKFEDLLKRICRDPAMILYLDSASSRKENPNENFARELLELFTLGEGHYTEKDIKEAARAFTGFTVEPEGFIFRSRWHDGGEKTFLGVKGRFRGEDIAGILLKQPRTADYLAERLLRFFVNGEPSRELIGAMAAKLRSTGFDIRETMRTLLLSEAFYASDVMGNHIKSPPEFVVSTIKSLGLDPQACDWWGLSMMVGEMGQELYQPPNVKGWDGGVAWVSAATLVKRQQCAIALIEGMPARAVERRTERLTELSHIKEQVEEKLGEKAGVKFAPLQVPSVRQERYDVASLLEGRKEWTAAALVAHIADRLLSVELPPRAQSGLVDMLGSPDKTIDATDRDDVRTVEKLLQAIMTLPEFQVS
jgi:hypothetical protein